MAEPYDYETPAEAAEKAAYECVEAFQASGGSAGLATDVASHLDRIPFPQDRDNAYAGVIGLLAETATGDVVQALLSKISESEIAARAADSAAKIYFSRGQPDVGKGLLAAAEQRIDALSAPRRQAQALIDHAVVVIDLGQNPEPLAKRAKIVIGGAVAEPWGMEHFLEIAELESGYGDTDAIITTLDSVSPHLQQLPEGVDRDLLLNRASELYLLAGEQEKAIALARGQSADNLSLSSRTTAQQTLLKKGDFDSAARLISLIEEPFQRFLAIETWMFQATGNGDRRRADQGVSEILRMLPSLDDGEQKFEAYLLVAGYRIDLGEDQQARQMLDGARQQIPQASPSLQKELKNRLRSLESVLEM